MALPLLLGLAGSALAPTLGVSALTAGAVGSGLGSLAQGDDFETAIGTGILSYLGGKALGGTDLFKAGQSAGSEAGNIVGSGVDLADPMRLAGTTAGASGAGMAATPALEAATQNVALESAKSGLPGALSALKQPETIGALGTTGLIEASKPPKMDFKTEDYPYIPEAEPARRKRNPMLPGYRPGFDPEMPYFSYAGGGEMPPRPLSLREIADMKIKEIMEQNEGFFVRDDLAKKQKEEAEKNILARMLGLGGSGIDIEGRKTARDMAKKQFMEENPELFKRLMRRAEGGEMSAPNDKEIINNAVDAIKGTDPEPERSLAIFVSTYGEEALKDLVERVRSGQFDDNAEVSEGMVEGVGDGMDDMIPATLEGEQDVVLSDGEFIVPADVVSGLGNGSTDAGADSLYEMMDRVRQMRTGKSEQPEQVPQGMMLPA